ncbi:N-acetyl-gamma-glutamyl-phosphate reductase [Aliidiomarina celeris]|uniref:N-acetyl-gamma-glutamyl-phosphate reductase n=1 Tax=Aliidiomarina celeris TaxID=2249428 RepID=UPI001300849E|nr:N-acetyl-gamma-glutamyl-phosphate reductase [Aliidiomarina celeris]
MIQCIVLGASGYSGSELLSLLHKNSHFNVVAAFGSEQREAMPWHAVSPATFQQALRSAVQRDAVKTQVIEPWNEQTFARIHQQHAIQAAFLALPHEASAVLAPKLAAQGIKVFDLSGAYRFKDAKRFAETYGFEHPAAAELAQVPYMLMPFLPEFDQEQAIFAIPGCYPTASLLALKPLVEHSLLATDCTPVITAISGVSGAGKGANSRTSFCEVSLQAYGVLSHRHQPEIAQQLGCNVIFTPILGPYARGILAVCVAHLAVEQSVESVRAYYEQCYTAHELVQLVEQPPAVAEVANTPFCLLHIAVKNKQVVVTAAIDNLIMGAAGQAMQAANKVFQLPPYAGLMP